MNKVLLVGNLATDVKLKDIAGDRTVASFMLAVDRQGRDSDSDYPWVETWNGTAKACGDYLAKGSKVAVEGSIRTRRFEVDGVTRYETKVNATRVEFLSPRSQAQPPAVETTAAPPADDDIPF